MWSGRHDWPCSAQLPDSAFAVATSPWQAGSGHKVTSDRVLGSPRVSSGPLEGGAWFQDW